MQSWACGAVCGKQIDCRPLSTRISQSPPEYECMLLDDIHHICGYDSPIICTCLTTRFLRSRISCARFKESNIEQYKKNEQPDQTALYGKSWVMQGGRPNHRVPSKACVWVRWAKAKCFSHHPLHRARAVLRLYPQTTRSAPTTFGHCHPTKSQIFNSSHETWRIVFQGRIKQGEDHRVLIHNAGIMLLNHVSGKVRDNASLRLCRFANARWPWTGFLTWKSEIIRIDMPGGAWIRKNLRSSTPSLVQPEVE